MQIIINSSLSLVKMYSCAIFFAILAYTVAYNFDDPAFSKQENLYLKNLY